MTAPGTWILLAMVFSHLIVISVSMPVKTYSHKSCAVSKTGSPLLLSQNMIAEKYGSEIGYSLG
jgi:hypothetical protein